MNTNVDYWKKRLQEYGEYRTVSTHHADSHKYYANAWSAFMAMKPLISQLKPITVMDFGCGNGRFVPYLMPYAHKYYGVDINPGILQRAMRRYETEDIQFGLIGDDGNIPAGRQKFDLILTCVVLQHVVDNELAQHYLNQFRRLLMPDGRLLIYEGMAGTPNDPSYLKFRSPQVYQDMIESAGFTLIEKSNPGKDSQWLMCAK